MTAGGLHPIWAGEGVALGAWAMIPCATVAEAIARTGFDFVCIDMQHGLMDYGGALAMVQAVDLGGAIPVVRVPWNEPGIIGRVLDAGALGIVVPMIDSVEDAASAVAACRYAPAGRRSFGPLRVGLRDGPTYFEGANARIAVIAMIETRAALRVIDDIVALPGIDAAFVGPFDLSVALGLPPGDNDGNPLFDDALGQVLDACRRHRKAAGILANRAVSARRIAQGFQFVSVTSDFPAFAGAMVADLAAARAGNGSIC